MTSISKQSAKKACMTCGQEYADAPDKCPFDGTALSTIGTELMPGAILGDRYEIISAVASGGMGQIYKAKHQLMNRVVAIKTIHMTLMSGSALKRFQQEAQAISTLNHPNILSVFDFFISEDGQPYLVMDYLQGTNLREVLNTDKKFELSRAIKILIEACAGFQHAHENGVVHRDIKPANLMLINSAGNPDFVKIVDFGIAKVVSESIEEKHLTATGDTFGSPEFMSPEQCRAKIPDARSDIYSLGCVMYLMVTGSSPFTSQDPMEIMYKQVHDSPPAPSKICPEAGLTEAVDALVLKAIQKEPEDRFQSMNEMRQALLAVSAQLETSVEFVQTGQIAQSGRSADLAPPAQKIDALNDTRKTTAVNTGKNIAVKNQALAASVAIGVAVVAVIVIAVGVYKTNQTTQKSTTKTQRGVGSETFEPKAPLSAASNQPETKAQSPAQAAPVGAVVTPVVTENAQVQQLRQDKAAYETNYKNGETEFRVHHYPEARVYFNSAHSAASTFGQTDARYINSLYWISKCDLASGNYQQALSGLQFVAYAQKKHFGSKSRELRATEADLQAVKRALKR